MPSSIGDMSESDKISGGQMSIHLNGVLGYGFVFQCVTFLHFHLMILSLMFSVSQMFIIMIERRDDGTKGPGFEIELGLRYQILGSNTFHSRYRPVFGGGVESSIFEYRWRIPGEHWLGMQWCEEQYTYQTSKTSTYIIIYRIILYHTKKYNKSFAYFRKFYR